MAENRFAQYGPATAPNFAPPSYPYEGRQAAANLQGKNLENTKGQATLPYDVKNAKNQATISGIKAQSDLIDLQNKLGQAPGNTSLSGDAYLNSLPAGIRDTVRAISENRYAAPLNPRNPQQLQIINAVNHYQPGFDATLYNTRLAAIKNAAVGKLADSDNALHTALGHAALLYDQAAGTPQQPGPAGNDTGIGPLSMGVNAFENWWHKGSPGLVAYNDTAKKLGSESASVYQQGSAGERQGNSEEFDQDLPLAGKRAAIANTIDLYASKIASNLRQYEWGNRGDKPSLDLLNPADLAIMKRIAPEALDKYFSNKPDPMAQALGMSMYGKGNGPDGGGGTTNPPPPTVPFAPPPSGPTGPTGGNLGPSSNGYNEKPDPTGSAYWQNAAQQGMSYRDALDGYKIAAASRNLTIVTPPDPTAYGKAVSYMRAHPNVPYQAFDAIMRTPLDPMAAAQNTIAQNPGGAFAGHYYNQLLAGAPQALLKGPDDAAYYDFISRQQNPNASFLGDLAGTVGGAYGITKGVKAAAPFLGRYGEVIGGNAARAALTGDAIYGGVNGAAQNPDNPVLGGAVGMGVMTLGNLAGRYTLGPAAAWLGDTRLGQAAINAPRSLGQLAGLPASAPFAPPPAPSIKLSGTTRNALDGIVNRMQDAQSAGLPYMIADADPRLGNMLGSTTRFSPDVRAQAEGILIPRQAGQGERAIQQINSNLAPVGDVPALQTGIRNTAQAQSAPLYTAAKAQAVPDLVANPTLNEVLNRPAGQTAMRQGYNVALNKGEDVGTLSYGTDPQGNPVAFGNPSWNVLHYARQALDDSGETDVRQALDKQIAALNPGFKAADAAYSGAMKGADAMQAGSDATGIKVTPEATQRALGSFPGNVPQFQQGYASSLADAIERQRFSGNPYNLVNGSLGQQAKLAGVFPEGADAFNRAQALEGDMGRTYQTVLGNSATQGRAMDDKLFTMGDAADTGLDLGAAALTGTSPIAGLIGLGIRKGIDAAKFGMDRAKAETIAPFLMNPDPSVNLATLGDLVRANAARQAYMSRVGAGTGQIGAGLLSAPLIYGAQR